MNFLTKALALLIVAVAANAAAVPRDRKLRSHASTGLDFNPLSLQARKLIVVQSVKLWMRVALLFASRAPVIYEVRERPVSESPRY